MKDFFSKCDQICSLLLPLKLYENLRFFGWFSGGEKTANLVIFTKEILNGKLHFVQTLARLCFHI